MKTGIEIITEERQRQIDVEGWTSQHDDQHNCGELALAAAAYSHHVGLTVEIEHEYKGIVENYIPKDWPWDETWWKPSKDKIRNLAKAGALIAAEIDRLQREKESYEKK